MPTADVRVDIREFDGRFTWVVQATGPVEDLFGAGRVFDSRVEALRHFQHVSQVLGWENMVTEVLADT
jgi:hypothetical protein